MSEWQTMTLGEITDWFSGGTPSKQNESYWNGEIPWISARTLKGTRVSDSALKISQEGLKNGSRLAEKGDLLLLVRGSGLFNSIPISIVENSVAFNQDIKSIRLKEQYNYISPWFLLYWFHANTRILYGIMEETGIGAGKFDLPLLKDLTIEIPSKQELIEITKTCKSIDDKITLLRQQNQDLEELAQTLFKRWFVEFEFPNENEEPYKSSGGKMVESELGEIPEGWNISRLKEITTLVSRGISPKYLEEGGICVLNQRCIRNKSIDFAISRRHNNELKNAKSKFIKPFDILVNSTGVGTLGRTAVVKRIEEEPTTVDSHVSIIRANQEKTDKYFLSYLITGKEREIEHMAEGSTGQTELSRAKLNEMEVLLPSKALQNKFGDISYTHSQKISSNEQEIQTLTQLRDTLLPKLMSGELRVNMQ